MEKADRDQRRLEKGRGAVVLSNQKAAAVGKLHGWGVRPQATPSRRSGPALCITVAPAHVSDG